MTTANDLIDRFRGAVEDWGNHITDQFTLTANDPSGTIYQISNGPIKTFSETLTDNAVSKARGTDYTVNYNNNELTVSYTQTSGHVLTLGYTKVLYRDERVLTAMGDAVRRMYPRVYKMGECYVAGALSQFTYSLTSTTDVPEASSFASGTVPSDYVAAIARADLAKVQTRIHRAEYLPAGSAGAIAWRPFHNFSRTTAADLSTDAALIAGDVVKLIYSAPCTPPTTVDSVIDVPDAFIDLPVWYALGMLVARKEVVRDRSDALFPQGYGVMTTPPGTQLKTGTDYMTLFWQTLRDNPMRPMATEIRKQVPAWARNLP